MQFVHLFKELFLLDNTKQTGCVYMCVCDSYITILQEKTVTFRYGQNEPRMDAKEKPIFVSVDGPIWMRSPSGFEPPGNWSNHLRQ
jgi:hypothetical protein